MAMFKKLKDKIAEEVKQSPLKIQQLAQSVVSPGSSSVLEPAANENFSIGDDDAPQDLLGKEGFTVVDLHHPSTPLPPAGSAISGRISRHSSVSSLASDASSAFFTIHDSSLGAFNMQMDLESASEREDAVPQLNNITKEELYHAYLKLHRHYEKYKGRTHDLRSHCRELDKDNKKHKAVLLECQEKSLRRMAELKEQCALEQHAKAHLEEALRNDLEEKDHLIQTLQTKIKLLKDTVTSQSGARLTSVDQNIESAIEERMTAETSEDLLDFKEPLSECGVSPGIPAMNLPSENYSEGNLQVLKEKLDLFQKEIRGSILEVKDIGPVLKQCEELVNCINVVVSGREITGDAFTSNNSEVLVKNSDIHRHEGASGEILLPSDVSKLKDSEHDRNILELTKLIIKQEKFYLILQNLRDLSSSLSNDISDEKMLDGRENYIENTFTDLFNEVCEFKDKTVNLIESEMPLISDIKVWKNKLNCQMENTADALMNIIQKYKVAEMNVLALNKSIRENRVTECILRDKVEDFNKINKELEKTISEKVELGDLIFILQKELEELKHKEEQASQSLLIMEMNLKKSELKCIEHHNKLIAQQGDMNEIVKHQNDLENEFKTSQNELGELKQKYIEVCQELVFCQDQNREQSEGYSLLKAELAATHATLEEKLQENTQLNELYLKSQKEMNAVNNTVEKATKMILSKEEMMNNTQRMCDSLKVALDTTQANVDVLLKDRSESKNKEIDIKRELEKSVEYCKELKKELVLSQKKLIEKDENNSEILNKLKLTNENLEKVNGEKEEITKTVDSAKQDLNKCKEKYQMVEEELVCLKKKVAEDMVEGSNLQDELSSLRVELTSSVGENIELNNMIGDLQKEVSSMRKQYKQVTQDLASNQHKIEEQDVSNTQLKDKLTTAKRSLEEAVGKEAAFKEALAALQRERDDATDSFKKVNEDLILTQKESAERQCRCVNLQQELCLYHENLKEALTRNTDAHEKLAEFEKKHLGVQQEHELVVQDMAVLKYYIIEYNSVVGDELATKQVELEEMSKEKTEMSRRLTDSQEELGEISEKYKLTSSNLTSVNEKLKENEKKLLELEENLAISQIGLQEAISEKKALNEIISTLQEESHALKRNNREANHQLTTCRSRIADLEDKVTHLKCEMNNTSITIQTVQEALIKGGDEVKSLRIANIQLTHELELASLQTKESDLGTSELKGKLLTALRDLEEAINRKNRLENALNAYQTELGELRYQYDKICQEVVSLQVKNKEHVEGTSHIKAELAATCVELEEATCRRTELNELFLACRRELDEMKGKYTQVTEELSFSQKVFAETSLLNSHLRGDLATSEASLQEVLMEKIELERKSTYPREDLELKHKKFEDDESNIDILYGLALTREDLRKSSEEKEELTKNLETVKDELKECMEKSLIMEEELVSCKKKLEELKETATHVRGEVGGDLFKIPEKISSRDAQSCSSGKSTEVSSVVESGQISFSSFNTSEDNHPSLKNGAGKQMVLDEDYKTFLLSDTGNAHKAVGSETVQGDGKGVEFLRDRLSTLSRELYETKEKYRKLVATSMKNETADSDIEEPDWDKMSIEMEYLRNIVYQYMMGKETMLLAKVISAVMKFDEQQINQIMQKEHHKQTLLGQLGIL